MPAELEERDAFLFSEYIGTDVGELGFEADSLAVVADESLLAGLQRFAAFGQPFDQARMFPTNWTHAQWRWRSDAFDQLFAGTFLPGPVWSHTLLGIAVEKRRPAVVFALLTVYGADALPGGRVGPSPRQETLVEKAIMMDPPHFARPVDGQEGGSNYFANRRRVIEILVTVGGIPITEASIGYMMFRDLALPMNEDPRLYRLISELDPGTLNNPSKLLPVSLLWYKIWSALSFVNLGRPRRREFADSEEVVRHMLESGASLTPYPPFEDELPVGTGSPDSYPLRRVPRWVHAMLSADPPPRASPELIGFLQMLRSYGMHGPPLLTL